MLNQQNFPNIFRGQFIRELENNITDIDNLVLSRIENKEDIYQSIKDFLGKGK